ncbi:MAG: hypothetical protein LBG96_05405 [Tannerella sp.]|jgi:hypothetical protein|nr:hypothetical protein [Tannerella sp.]
MRIANPIYDVVFKFMMEDNRVAKAFLSAIIQEKVVKLDFASQEHTVRIPAKRGGRQKQPAEKREINFTVCRFDFSAKISTPDGGHKTVLIELQKAKLSSDIMRFRRYLGLHYQNADNACGEAGNRKARQIYCIFLLGYDIGIPDCPVIRVDTETKDVATNEDVNASNDFINSLHHRSWIVQTNQLRTRRRTALEKLLSIFDQEDRNKNHHILNVEEKDFPEEYRSIIRRLRMASESEQIQIEMEMEDDYLKELQDKEREIALREEIIEEQGKALEEKDKALGEKDKTLGEKDKALEEKDKALGEKDKTIEEQARELDELKKQLDKYKGTFPVV